MPYSYNNSLVNFSSYNSTLRGIQIAFSDNNTLSDFDAFNNTQYGLYFSSSNNKPLTEPSVDTSMIFLHLKYI